MLIMSENCALFILWIYVFSQDYKLYVVFYHWVELKPFGVLPLVSSKVKG
jgi:hypothetical protein